VPEKVLKQKLLTFSRYIPRKNFPPEVAGKRGESTFARSFQRAYLKQLGKAGLGGSEFGLADFGIADFIWISWYPDKTSSASAIALEQTLKKQIRIFFRSGRTCSPKNNERCYKVEGRFF
jgi:hypothetical protein